MTEEGLLIPDWPVQGVGACMSTRAGGVSIAPYDSLNLGATVGDAALAVQENRRRFARAMPGATPVFLKQVHGTRVLRLVDSSGQGLEADASITTRVGVVCTVQVADCLPVLFAAPSGVAVGGAHAGWRGLAAGVLEATLKSVCDAADCGAESVLAWLGPCIGPRRFEVGEEVRRAFALSPEACFQPLPAEGKYLADLAGLAHWRLLEAGMKAHHVHGGKWCTVETPSRFFSFRRDGVTGRMAAAIWRLA